MSLRQEWYRTLDKLLPHKEQLEIHLKERMGTLFDLEYDILLYDVTITYFESPALNITALPDAATAGTIFLTANRSVSGWWSVNAACR